MVTAWGARLGVGYIPGAKGSVTIFVPLSVVIWKKLCPKYCTMASDAAAYATGMKPRAISWSRQAAATGELPQAMSTRAMYTSTRIACLSAASSDLFLGLLQCPLSLRERVRVRGFVPGPVGPLIPRSFWLYRHGSPRHAPRANHPTRLRGR